MHLSPVFHREIRVILNYVKILSWSDPVISTTDYTDLYFLKSV
jgi:hypothetical protein